MTPAELATAVEHIRARMARRREAQAADERALAVLVRQLRGEPANDVAIDVESIRAQVVGLAAEQGEM